jgi:hypothetical protein
MKGLRRALFVPTPEFYHWQLTLTDSDINRFVTVIVIVFVAAREVAPYNLILQPVDPRKYDVLVLPQTLSGLLKLQLHHPVL